MADQDDMISVKMFRAITDRIAKLALRISILAFAFAVLAQGLARRGTWGLNEALAMADRALATGRFAYSAGDVDLLLSTE